MSRNNMFTVMNNQGFSDLKYIVDKKRDIYFIIPKSQITKKGEVKKSVMNNIKNLNIVYLEEHGIICNNVKKLIDIRKNMKK